MIRLKFAILFLCLVLMTLLVPPAGAKEQVIPLRTSVPGEYVDQNQKLQAAARAPSQPAPHRSDHILVKFKDKLSKTMVDSVQTSFNTVSAKQFKHVKNLHLIRLPKGLAVDKAIASYKKNPDVLYAEPDYIVKALAMPNDPSFSSLWGLMNTGQNSGTVGADINVTAAWDVSTGSKDVVVAVIDTGIDYTHQDLADNIWSNKAECTLNGIDDDGNGYIDDCHGINVIDRFSPPMDDYGHGSHVSGTIGATGNNSIGVAGVNWDVSIMACKFLDYTGSGSTSGAIECLDYVRDMKSRGVNIIATSNSWGGGDYSQGLYDAIEANLEAGILFINAAGNSGYDNDVSQMYPASYSLPNIIAVSATDGSDNLAFFSDDGRRSVHIGAPGVDILSTIPNGSYDTYSGTSMATPHVTGVAALLKAQDPTRDWTAIRNIILSSGKTVPSLWNTISGKRLDASNALTCSNRVLLSRLSPQARAIRVSVGETVNFSVLHVNCAIPNGEVTVTVEPGGDAIVLKDDGNAPDMVKGDGIYVGQWIAAKEGIFLFNIPDDDTYAVQVLNKNPGLFDQPVNFHISNGANAVAVGDLNGDGRNDVVVAIPGVSYADNNSYLRVFLQDASGNLNSTFTYTTGVGWISSVAIGDINSDGKKDLVIGHVSDEANTFPDQGYIAILLQDETGAFGPMKTYPTPNATMVRMGDLNNDGLPDVASTGTATDAVQVFYQNKDGTLSAPMYFPVKNHGLALEIADLNNDGLNDIVVGSRSGLSKPSLGILYQGSGGTFQPPVYRNLRGLVDRDNVGINGVAVGDINGDGLQDLACSHDCQNQVSLLAQTGSLTLSPSIEYPIFQTLPGTIRIGDVNSDGRQDIVVSSPGFIGVYLQSPTGSFFPALYYPAYSQYPFISNLADGFALGDVNGDGLIDFVASDFNNGLIIFYGNPNAPPTMGTLGVQTNDVMGEGSGSIVSDPPGINCGPGNRCSASYALGTRVRLTAIPEPGSFLGTWYGPCEVDADGGCTVTIDRLGPHVSMDWQVLSVTITLNKKNFNGGTGTVVSDLPGINCGSICQASFPASRGYVRLRATANPGSRLGGWGGNCDAPMSDKTCLVRLIYSKTVDVSFIAASLYVSIVGHGTVVSTPAGVNCTGTTDGTTSCPQGNFGFGTSVTLNAAAPPGWQFSGWSSGACSGTGSCAVALNDYDTYVTATFIQLPHTISVTKTGNGSGTVTSSPAGINCGGTCSAVFAPTGNVVLIASPAPGSMFTSWVDCPSPSGFVCTIPITSDISVTAGFEPAHTLTVTKTGMGSVTSIPSGIDCGTTCSAPFAPGSTVTLNAAPSQGYAFAYWSGACGGASTTCKVVMASDASVTVVFDPVKTRKYRLTVARRKLDKGDGTVTSSDSIITCNPAGGTCTAMYYPHAPVTLSAVPSQDSTFTGWSGACSGTGPCNVTMDKAKSVIAIFVGPQKLTVRKQSLRRGTGTVTSSSGGIDCGSNCPVASAFYPLHQTVTLTATPDPGSEVTAWKPKSLNCSGMGCTVTMDKHLAVAVTFGKAGMKGEEESDEDWE